jgi:hypothetical protein
MGGKIKIILRFNIGLFLDKKKFWLTLHPDVWETSSLITHSIFCSSTLCRKYFPAVIWNRHSCTGFAKTQNPSVIYTL